MIAYNIEILKKPATESERFDGWIFGLPPGIKSEQWPIDPNTGYPLMHGFTLKLPEGYRVYDGIVGISFFAIAIEHNDGGPKYVKGLEEAVLSDQLPENPSFKEFWDSVKNGHPRCKYVTDILGCYYATLLLTEEEFNGDFCEPPKLLTRYFENDIPSPDWLKKGGASCFWKQIYSPGLSLPPEEYGIYRDLGGIPTEELSYSRAILLKLNPEDPNAGTQPTDDAGTGYIDPYEDEPSWANTISPNHLGGTTFPAQGIPDFLTPYYIEFEEVFGGYNFGSGNAQLDIKNRNFDWSCG
ncbi:hypothetical protein KUV44_15700 [Marinobacter daepoensis]|uniref:DUF1963 domain-containing protein n=1 Tax=Marinobacter daepoensis TaxID=262077 RepID=A0ABS3BBR5_9GAMM|nr:hypothetical protein [Marinobacter daepoensis]MBN7768291.1 hypothetical protein [Marinobacter daepoensis]MBY6080592.1 hypothetical protein [Marinobacter daepoensis]